MSTNPFEEGDDSNSTDGEILMGFLCPICHKDLKTVELLTEHFESSHAEEQDALKSIFKDIFAKAKKKIKINFEDSFELARSSAVGQKSSTADGASVSSGESTATTATATEAAAAAASQAKKGWNFHEPQDVGVERGHFEYFQSIRMPRLERYASETNILIMRLHELLAEMPVDPVQRKQHEKKTVPWLDGTTVKLCPNCAKKFNLARRQHHCRLCGSIMCSECSKSLPIEDGLNLASLNMSLTPSVEKLKAEAATNPEETALRCCDHCLWLLETRKIMQESRCCAPPITEYYADIQKAKKSVMPDIDMYLKIVTSLLEGESIFTLADASALRGKIGQIAEFIDLRSKRILLMECEPGSRQESLKKAIRLSCIQLIKDKMLSLPPLPKESEIRRLQEEKRLEAERKRLEALERKEIERRMAQEAYERYGLAGNANDSNAFDSPSSNTSRLEGASDDDDDPLLEQIDIIKGYIRTARKEMNFDIIETLERNLRELQLEHEQRLRDKRLRLADMNRAADI